MELIVHERQEGFLCAQHCLNALLQGSYFTPVDLATLGQQMDDEERFRMAECGVESDEYQKFLKQPSGNMDDSGFFSVQVISSALKVWGLELVPYDSSDPEANEARKNPEKMQAYICNFKQHWLTIRKLGNQWFNLNSLLTAPELLSNTYLGMFLAQLQNDGYSIFIVIGNLPFCQADLVLKESPVIQYTKPKFIVTENQPSSSNTSSKTSSRTSNQQNSRVNSINTDEEDDIQRAINLSLGLDELSSQQGPTLCQSDQSKSFSISTKVPSSSSSCSSETFSRETSQDEQLQSAIRLSLEPFLSEQSSSMSVKPASNSQ